MAGFNNPIRTAYMPISQEYDRVVVDCIQLAYRSLFPTLTPALREYWGLDRRREWAVLTSDFHAATFDQYADLHARTAVIDGKLLDVKQKGASLRDAALSAGVGFSIGVCPWTDHLLYETWSADKDSVTILLGHDWYPIVVDGTERSGSPLQGEVALRYTEGYWPAVPQAVFDGKTIGLFLNLYPDFRPPGDKKCGSLVGYEYSYDACLTGLDAIIDIVCSQYKEVQIISWGSNVWRVLSGRVSGIGKKISLTSHIANQSGSVLSFTSGRHSLPFLPIVHPGLWGNFGRTSHLVHVNKGFQALGLGLPGPSKCTSLKLSKARSPLY